MQVDFVQPALALGTKLHFNMIRNPRQRIKSVESCLQQLKSFVSLNVCLEQYQTPPRLASELLGMIRCDIEGKTILDLGCGTGILGFGCILLGASRVVGVDVDSAAIEVAKQNAEKVGLSSDDISFVVKDVNEMAISDFPLLKFDTVVMNPPFGTKKESGVDYEFVQKGLQFANKVYSLHKSSTRNFWINKVGWEVKILESSISFCIANTYKFHKEVEKCVDVDFLCHSKNPVVYHS